MASSAADDARKRIMRRGIVEKMMEAAFDNELEDVIAGFDKARAAGLDVPIDPVERPGVVVAASDREDSLLGEASCGNAVDVAKHLIELGADIGYKGKYNRTPLHRALNNDALDAVKLLLQRGADPRLLVPQEREAPSDEFPNGRVLFHEWDPKEVDGLQCSIEAKKLLRSWDISVTLRLLAQMERERDAKHAAATAARTAAAEQTGDRLQSKKSEHDAAVTALGDAIRRREQRILEYDTMKCEGKSEESLAVLDGMIKSSIEEVKSMNLKVAELELQLRAAKREARVAQSAAEPEAAGPRYNATIGLAQLEDVVIMDHDDSLKSSSKVCLLVDRTGNALTFLSYRPVTIIDIANSHHMYPRQLKLSVVGALRYGKPLIVNTRDKDLPESFALLQKQFNAAHADLLPSLLNGKATDPAIYRQWLSTDIVEQHPEYSKEKFMAADTLRFRFVLLTHEECPQDWEVVSNFYSVLVE